jgi:pSer/pThr/pTyr-binding forkhead associated (FHA) protein/predicted Ser/Thr protein kinase
MAAEQLLVVEGEDPGAVLSVEQELLVGRLAPSEEGRLGDDPGISRRHARISRTSDGQLRIEDLGSANGTYVNGERIATPRVLNVDDVLRLGTTVLKVTGRVGAAPKMSVPAGTKPAAEPEVSDAAAGWALMVIGGEARGRRIALADELVIGRDVSGEGRLGDDPKLSRRHARVARGPAGQFTVEDLGSANGTFVNGKRVRGRQILDAGDRLQVGATTLQLSELRRTAAQPLPPRSLEPPPAPARAGAPPLELPAGSVFAGCRVEDVIGHGDMGVLYRAEELALRRPVALKLILAEHAGDERFRERFRRESKIAAAIDHPNVIPIFDAGEERGVLYILMRLVEGTDLRALIAAEGPLDPLRAARIVQQVGAALDAAHARGILHRDVKPSNVLLAARDHVYLTDFGLAKHADSADGLTRRGTVVARVEYVAPELILGQRVDARADVYALACLLFEALTGEAPFARWTGGPEALAHLEAPRPSPVDLRPDLPREFEDVVRRGMATDSDERYPSAGDLGQAALVAAGGLRRARPWSVVATGEAAPSPVSEREMAQAPSGAPPGPEPGADGSARPNTVGWVIALAGLVLVAAGMVAALIGISSL